MARGLSLATALILLACALFLAAEAAIVLRHYFAPTDATGAPLPAPTAIAFGPVAAPMVPLPLTLVVLAAMCAARARWILPVAAIAVSMAVARPYGLWEFHGPLGRHIPGALRLWGPVAIAVLAVLTGLLALRSRP